MSATLSSAMVDRTKSSLTGAYVAIVAMLIVPQFFLVHPYLHLLIVAPLLVWTGCQRSLLQMETPPEESQVETVSKKDAMKKLKGAKNTTIIEGNAAKASSKQFFNQLSEIEANGGKPLVQGIGKKKKKNDGAAGSKLRL